MNHLKNMNVNLDIFIIELQLLCKWHLDNVHVQPDLNQSLVLLHNGWLVGCYEDLRRFSDKSGISRLGSSR